MRAIGFLKANLVKQNGISVFMGVDVNDRDDKSEEMMYYNHNETQSSIYFHNDRSQLNMPSIDKSACLVSANSFFNKKAMNIDSSHLSSRFDQSQAMISQARLKSTRNLNQPSG